ncbi:hypothetical protein CLMAG_30860 [Clostridium magnum DSM 2767]|uniref:Uncharacterized protein n=1 Tax=Clostridium magnum DSM 2767 TaxID=1121326 RepID=A0A162SIR7_9CLOT|nr:hypothetical protein CLMAG_30860 [Clostridium magnum DSM 2767]
MLTTPNSKTDILDFMKRIEFVSHMKNKGLVNIVMGF